MSANTTSQKLIAERARVSEVTSVNRAVIPIACNRIKYFHFYHLNHKSLLRPSLVSLNLGSVEAISRARPEQFSVFSRPHLRSE